MDGNLKYITSPLMLRNTGGIFFENVDFRRIAGLVLKGVFASLYLCTLVFLHLCAYLRLKPQVMICRPFRTGKDIFALWYFYILASIYFGIYVFLHLCILE